jgi:hypothetical protein
VVRPAAAAIALLALATFARAASITWTGPSGGDWNAPANWSGAAVPAASDDVSITAANVVVYATAAAPSVNSLTLGAGAVLRTDAGLVAAGAVTVQAQAALQFGATAQTVAGSFAFAAGSSAAYVGPPISAGTVASLHLQATTFVLAAGSTITVRGRGYAGGAGGALGSGSGGGGAGAVGLGGGAAGHGGSGGSGGLASNGAAAVGSMPPIDGGAGGGGGFTAAGGDGGGFLLIDATTAAIDGLLEADGGLAGSIGPSGGGGGAGGAIVVSAASLTGAGALSARGGGGGAGTNEGGGGGGGGRIWLRESGAFGAHLHSFGLLLAGGSGGLSGASGAPGSSGAAFVDARHWTGAGSDALASNAANWSEALAPSGGELLVFGSSSTAKTCSWDLGGVSVGSVAVTSAYAASLVLTAPMNVSGSFSMAGGTVSASGAGALSVGGAVSQSGGRLDLLGGTLTLAAAPGNTSAAFFDARVSSLTVGGVVVATVSVSGPLEVVYAPFLSGGATLSLSPSARLQLDGNGPFSGGGSVNASSASWVTAAGASTQTWRSWPGQLGSLRDSNVSAGGLFLSTTTTATRFTLTGGLTVDPGAKLTAKKTRLQVGGDWTNAGTAILNFSTTVFKGAAGVQNVFSGATAFDNIWIDDAGATLAFSTNVVAAGTVAVLSGTLDLGASTTEVLGSWLESTGTVVLPGTGAIVFDGYSPQSVLQVSGNSFANFRSSGVVGVTISSGLAMTGSFYWDHGTLDFTGAALSVGGNMIAQGGSGLTVAGSTATFAGTAPQIISFPNFGDLTLDNHTAAGVTIARDVVTASFRVRPGSVFNGLNHALTVFGPVFDTSFSTYLAVSPGHSVNWANSVTVGAGSLVYGGLSLAANKTAALLGDLTVAGGGGYFDPKARSVVVNAVGGSTITFLDSADLIASVGSNWSYGGDVANSWIVFEGSGVARGASISSNTLGSMRVSLNTVGDIMRLASVSLSGKFILESGTLRPAQAMTLAVAGDFLQTGGGIDFTAVSTGTLLLNGHGAQNLRLSSGAHSLWNLTDASSGTVALTSDLNALGDFTVARGTFAAGMGQLAVLGNVNVEVPAYFDGQSSTLTLAGFTGGRPVQSLSVAGNGRFNGLRANVATANLLTSVTAQVLVDAFPGGVLAAAAGAEVTAADLRLGPAFGANLSVRSLTPGSPWYLNVTSVSSATAVTASDSDASPGLAVLANDGRCVDGGGNKNWNFNPLLIVVLPGETFTPGVAPGKSGAPASSVAGTTVTVSVYAVSARFDVAALATGTVSLSGDDAYAGYGSSVALVNGSAVLSFIPRAAEPSPRATRIFASTFFGVGVATAAVVPAGLTQLQLLVPGEAAAPGSFSGRAGAALPRAAGVPFSVLVRAVDPFWNAVTTVTDVVAFGSNASSSSLPSPTALIAGQRFIGGVLILSTGSYALTATDLTSPGVFSSTSSVMLFLPPSASSPTVAFFVPSGAAVATLATGLAGTAADSAAVSRVLVDVLEVETGFHFNWSARSFSSLSVFYGTMTLTAPFAAATAWAGALPDAALSDGRHYAANAFVDDPSALRGTASSTFTVDRSALLYGSRSGQGSAVVVPPTATGCELVVTTVSFSVGPAGISTGGVVAVREPDGWTNGSWSLSSTAPAVALGAVRTTVGPAAFGRQALGPGWVSVEVTSSAAAILRPGDSLALRYAGLPPMGPGGRGTQAFAVWTAPDGSSPISPVPAAPAMFLTPGTTNFLAFVDPAPMYLSPLQTSATMQLKLVDACGGDKSGSGSAALSFVAPSSGAFAADSSVRFFAVSGGTVTSLAVSTGTPPTRGFLAVLSTASPSFGYVQAQGSFTISGQPIFVEALRAAYVLSSSAALTRVSIDNGVLTPGATSAAFSGAAPDSSFVRLVFTVPDPDLHWDATISADPVAFSSPVFVASGVGDPARPVAVSWDGVVRAASPVRYAAPGHLAVRLRAGGAVDTSLEVLVPPTAGYVGLFGPSGAGALVRAIGPGAGEGAQAVASATGFFVLSGLRPGQAYQLSASTLSVVLGRGAPLSASFGAPPAQLPPLNLGALALPSPGWLRVAAVLPVPAPLDLAASFTGRALDGSTAFSGTLRFSSGAATSDDGGPLFGRAASTWSLTSAATGLYSVSVDVPDIGLSTMIAGVSLSTAGYDLVVFLNRRASASGAVSLPSAAAPAVPVTIAASLLGAAQASAFTATTVSTNAAFTLYGLAPGSWTAVASAPGYVSAATTFTVSAGSDVSGLSLVLSSGGAVSGFLFVTGDTTKALTCLPGARGAPGACLPGDFDVALTAWSTATGSQVSSRARLTGSVSGSSAAYVLAGLEPGVWALQGTLPGFASTNPAGALFSVTAGSASTATLTLAPLDARLRMTVRLPPLPGGACRGAGAWSSVGYSLEGGDGATRIFGDATTPAGPGSFASLDCSSATFFTPALPPGVLRASARDGISGLWAGGASALVSGSTASLTLDLAGASTTVAGLLTTGGVIAVPARGPAGGRYLLAASSAAAVLSAAPTVSFCLLGSSNPVTTSALRAELIPFDAARPAPPLRRATGGPGSCASPAPDTAPATSLAYVAAVRGDGTFAFAPGVPPGSYFFRVPGDLDDDPSDGDEAATFEQFVTVGPAGATLSPRLTHGARVFGTVAAPPNFPRGGLIRVALLGEGSREVRAIDVSPAPGATSKFSIENVGDGVYTLTATDLASPRSVAAASSLVSVAGADVGGRMLTLADAASIRARLAVMKILPDGTRESTLVTAQNAGLLPQGFRVTAAAEPAAAGSYVTSAASPDGSVVDAQGRVVLDGLPAGVYDVDFAAPSDPAALRAGALAFAPTRVAGLRLGPGQIADLGVVALNAAAFLTGRVLDASTGLPVAGVPVRARATDSSSSVPDAVAFTDASGRYLLLGLDPSRRWFDVTAAPRASSVSGDPVAPYAPRRFAAVDLSNASVLDFALTPAPGLVSGRIVAPLGAPLFSSLGAGDPAGPGAVVTLTPSGATAGDASIAWSVRTAPDGAFVIPAVATGTYRFTAAALGQGSTLRALNVGVAPINLGDVPLGTGGTLSGALRLPDGSSPSTDEAASLAFVAPDASEYYAATLSYDASGRGVSGYSVGGLTPGKAYRLVVTGPGGTSYTPPEAAAVVVASSTTARILDLTLRPAAGPVALRARREGARWLIAAQFPRPVRSRFLSDSDPSMLLSTAAAAGALSGGSLSSDRRTVTAYYDPAPGETTAVLRASAAFSAVDWNSASAAAPELSAGVTVALNVAADAVTRNVVPNSFGGELTFDGNSSRLFLPRGAFAVDAGSNVVVALSRAQSSSAFALGAPPANVASPFYDVTLPGGAPAVLLRPAELTLVYSTAVADPSLLHVYWYNPASRTYVLQPDALGGPLVVDTSARTVKVHVPHFSTYVLLDASLGSIGGSAFAGGEIEAFNFPNPFDLSVKTVSTIHGAGTISVRGTMIRVGVPAGLSGAGTFRVFDVTGRLVRTMDLGSLSGGQVYYQGWDGRNDFGLDVASGLYLGQVEVGGRRKTFKLAVLK